MLSLRLHAPAMMRVIINPPTNNRPAEKAGVGINEQAGGNNNNSYTFLSLPLILIRPHTK
jgi:hypothetical protein